MTSHERKRLDDLERRVKELEARPMMPTIIIQPYVPPAEQFRPYAPVGPTIIWGADQTVQPFLAPGAFTC